MEHYFEIVVFAHKSQFGHSVPHHYSSIITAINVSKQIMKDDSPESIMIRENTVFDCGIEENGPVIELTEQGVKLYGKEPV